MNKVRLIAKVNYTTKSNAKFSNKIAYNNLLDGMSINELKKHMEFKNFSKKIDYNNFNKNDKKLNHDEYFSSSNLPGEVFTSDGILKFKTKELQEFMDSYDNASKLGMTIVSFSEVTSEKIKAMKLSEEELFEKFKEPINKYFEENKLLPGNISYNFAFHSDKKHFHFHLDYIEKSDTRNDFTMTQQSIKHLKRDILNEIDPVLVLEQNKMEKALNHAKEEYRKRASEISLNIPTKQLNYMFKLMNEEQFQNQMKMPGYYNNIKSPELKEMIRRLAKEQLSIDDKYIKAIEDYRKFSNGVYGEKVKASYRLDIEQLELRSANTLWRKLKPFYFGKKIEITAEQINENVKLFAKQDKENIKTFMKSQSNNIESNINKNANAFARKIRNYPSAKSKTRQKNKRELDEILYELYGMKG